MPPGDIIPAFDHNGVISSLLAVPQGADQHPGP
jgi:hypothetical protein